MYLDVKLLVPGAKAPVCSRPGEDLGYDIFALEDITLHTGIVTKVRTGVAVAGNVGNEFAGDDPCGFIIKDRSSMASKGITVSGGVIDSGYRGEIVVLLTKSYGTVYGEMDTSVNIKAGDKIAQLVPVPVLTGEVIVVDELTMASRGDLGFGSSGR